MLLCYWEDPEFGPENVLCHGHYYPSNFKMP